MTEPSLREETTNLRLPNRKWLLRLGATVTTLWLASGVVYLAFLGGWQSIATQGADALGGFLEGFFAPLAFLWLVVGLFIQQRELASNTEALKQTNAHSERQTEVLAATELRARQSAFFQIAENVRRQTGNLAGLLVRMLEDKDGKPLISDDEMIEHWTDHQHGQFEIFPALLSLSDPSARFVKAKLDPDVMFYGSETKQGLTTEYIRSFRGLIQLAKDCDNDGTIVRTITQTPHGQVYNEMLKRIRPPVCWALLDAGEQFATPQSSPNFFGTWRIYAKTMYGDQQWFTTFSESDEGIRGVVHLDDTRTPIQDVAIAGAAIFGRVVIGENFFIMTARVEGASLQGQLDFREGAYATFSGVHT